MDDLIQQVQDKLRDIQDKIDELQAKVNGVLDDAPWWVPGWVIDKVHDAWNWLCDKLGESLEGYWLLLDQAGEPWVLRPAADSWVDDIGAPVSAKASTVDAGVLQVDNNWEGTAATEYFRALPLQKAAMTSIKKDIADTMQAQLDKVANAMNIFVAACISALVALAAAVVLAIAGIAGIITAAPAILGLVTACGVAAAAYYAALSNLRGEGQNAESAMRAKLTDLTAFPNSAWPNMVV
jgi:uncharacterized protein YukE